MRLWLIHDGKGGLKMLWWIELFILIYLGGVLFPYVVGLFLIAAGICLLPFVYLVHCCGYIRRKYKK